MAKKVLLGLSLLGLVCVGFGMTETTCPPEGFRVKYPFAYENFFQGSWYPLMQTEVQYQPKESMFCIQANYQFDLTHWCKITGCQDKVVRVRNSGRYGVNGRRISVKLTGIITDPEKEPAKAMVGPWFLPSAFYGPYWVADAGTYQQLLDGAPFKGDNYEWAIIVGGSPDVVSNDKCLAGVGKNNAKGLWLFSRDPLPPQGVAEKLKVLAASKGLDTSTLLDVVHEGC